MILQNWQNPKNLTTHWIWSFITWWWGKATLFHYRKWLLAVVWAYKTRRHYLFVRKTNFICDHRLWNESWVLKSSIIKIIYRKPNLIESMIYDKKTKLFWNQFNDILGLNCDRPHLLIDQKNTIPQIKTLFSLQHLRRR